MTARGWFLFSLMGVVWGIPYLMIKVAVDAPLSPSMVVFTRCALGAVLLLPFALRQGGLTRVVRSHWRPMLAFACIEIIGPWFTLTDAERHLSSSTAVAFVAFLELIKEVGPTRSTVITYVNPAVAVAAGALFLGEDLTVGIGVAFTLILAGSVLATAGPGVGRRDGGRPVTWSARQ